MFIQGRLWQDTGGSFPWVAQEEGAGDSHICASISLPPPTTLPTRSPRNQQRPAPEWVHTPLFLGKKLVDLCHFPHTPGGGARISRCLSIVIVSPLGQTKGTLLCAGRVQGGVNSSYHCYSLHTWNSSWGHWLPRRNADRFWVNLQRGACKLGEQSGGKVFENVSSKQVATERQNVWSNGF